MSNERRLIDDHLLNRWLIIALKSRYIVNNSVLLVMQQRAFCCTRHRCHWGGILPRQQSGPPTYLTSYTLYIVGGIQPSIW